MGKEKEKADNLLFATPSFLSCAYTKVTVFLFYGKSNLPQQEKGKGCICEINHEDNLSFGRLLLWRNHPRIFLFFLFWRLLFWWTLRELSIVRSKQNRQLLEQTIPVTAQHDFNFITINRQKKEVGVDCLVYGRFLCSSANAAPTAIIVAIIAAVEIAK